MMKKIMILLVLLSYTLLVFAVQHGKKDRWCVTVREEIGSCKNPRLVPQPCEPQNFCKAGVLYCCEWDPNEKMPNLQADPLRNEYNE